jgi:hypothetical protein
MQDFPANSKTAPSAAEPREKLQPVTTAEPVRRKRGLGRQFKETFFSGDARSASQYMIEEIVVPAIRDTMFDAIQGGIERLVYGESTRKRPGSTNGYSNLGHVAYNRMSGSTPAKTSAPRMLSRSSRARHDFDELIIPSRQEAEEVIDQMFAVLSRYGSVSVADLYELTGVQSSHTDMKWGWTELRGAKAVRLRQGGFLLDLPEPEALN